MHGGERRARLPAGAEPSQVGFRKGVPRRRTPCKLGAAFGSHVMENVLFKIQAPVVIHAQSAIECAIEAASARARRGIDDIESIALTSHARTLATIDKTGPLRNAADRDHCLQYAVAVTLLNGRSASRRLRRRRRGGPAHRSLALAHAACAKSRATRRPTVISTRGANMNAIEVAVQGRLPRGSRGSRVSDRTPEAARGGHSAAHRRSSNATSRGAIPSRSVEGDTRRAAWTTARLMRTWRSTEFVRHVCARTPREGLRDEGSEGCRDDAVGIA